MECNKDEAIKAKELAVTKFTAKEYLAAKKFALKSRTLDPGLEGISQMLTMLDVYIAADNKVNGETDWYGVLGVNPLADDETLKKEYRKLALVLHPDKNKSVGAGEAFKYVSEAWSLLSDKVQRLAYDQKRSSKGPRKDVFSQKGGTSAPFRANDFRTSTNSSSSNATRMGRAAPSQPPKKSTTFWTVCRKCNTQYEYLRIYVNHTLLCPNCQEPFLAAETGQPPPESLSKSSHRSSHQQHQSSKDHASQKYAGFKQGPLPPARTASDTNAFTSTGPPVGPQMPYMTNREINLKKRKINDDYGNNYGRNMEFETGNVWGMSKDSFDKRNGSRELSPLELRNILMKKARTDIARKIQVWSSEAEIIATEKEKKKKKKNVNAAPKKNLYNCSESTGMKKGQEENKCLPDALDDDSDQKTIEPMPMNVPDSDFHNFDMDRTERAFGENQVWAAYDEDDGMPRYYAMIHKVISLNPFKVRFSWLNSRSTNEFSDLDWLGSGFNKICGEFRIGKYENYNALNSFSHKVTWTKGPRGVIHIYPKKGEIWALYRNWSPDWNLSTPDEEKHKYDMVEVLDDYDEKESVSVSPLVKVTGFKAVFQQHTDPCKVKRIPKEEMFRFSHQVPKYLITGKEGPKAPKGCCELDPAATPLELLDVLTDITDSSVLHNSAKAEKEIITVV